MGISIGTADVGIKNSAIRGVITWSAAVAFVSFRWKRRDEVVENYVDAYYKFLNLSVEIS